MSPPSYRGRQSDDDFQRHNADRHHREGSGQDRTGQSVLPRPPPKKQFWICGNCGEGELPIKYQLHCLRCGHLKDCYAREY